MASNNNIVIIFVIFFISFGFIYSLSMPIAKRESAGAAIFLSSFSTMNGQPFRSFVEEILGTELRDQKICYIPTASYCYNANSPKSKGEQRRRARYDAKQKGALLVEGLHLRSSALDILELDAPNLDKEKLSVTLSDSDIVYVDGGNTFYLQYHLQRSNFWEIADTLLENNRLYIGASAGAIVAGRSIETAYWKGWDDPKCVGDEIQWDQQRLKGRNMFAADLSFFMHYTQDHNELLSLKAPLLDHQVLCLADNTALSLTKKDVHAKFPSISMLYNTGKKETKLPIWNEMHFMNSFRKH